MLNHTKTHNISPNQSLEVHISSHTTPNILQNPSDTNFIILQNPSMFREKVSKHWNTNKSKTQHLNKNIEIQTLKFREIQNSARWVYRGRERKHGYLGRVRSWWTDRFQCRWEMGLLVVLGLRKDGFFSQKIFSLVRLWWIEPLVFDIKVGKRKIKGSECLFREVGEMSEWGSWIWSNGIWRKRAKIGGYLQTSTIKG